MLTKDNKTTLGLILMLVAFLLMACSDNGYNLSSGGNQNGNSNGNDNGSSNGNEECGVGGNAVTIENLDAFFELWRQKLVTGNSCSSTVLNTFDSQIRCYGVKSGYSFVNWSVRTTTPPQNVGKERSFNYSNDGLLFLNSVLEHILEHSFHTNGFRLFSKMTTNGHINFSGEFVTTIYLKDIAFVSAINVDGAHEISFPSGRVMIGLLDVTDRYIDMIKGIHIN